MSIRFDERFVQTAVPDVSIVSNSFPEQVRFSIDTRTLQEGDIFIAISGAKVDGHDYIEQAFKKGAAGIIIAAHKKDLLSSLDTKKISNKLVLIVHDTVQALIQSAILWRAQFDIPVIAITGSVGKTSTKEMLSNILALNGNKFLASQGNQNTRIGVSLNILRMKPEHQMAIFELGINKRGEMAELSRILRPTTSLITSIGHCHMEGLGSLGDIALEKRDVFKFFTEKNIGIVNGDQPILAAVSYAHPVLKFGTKTTNQIQARKIRLSSTNVTFVMKIYKQKYQVTLSKPHAGAVFNALASTAIAQLLGVGQETIVKGIQIPLTISGRFEPRPLKSHKGTIINDSYNANPESMKAALLAFQNIQTDAQKIAVLGDMLELGISAPFWHRQLGRFLRKVPSLRHVILVGDMVKWTKKTAPVNLTIEVVPSWNAAIDSLKNKLSEESVVLVKGSHGVGLSNIVEALTLS